MANYDKMDCAQSRGLGRQTEARQTVRLRIDFHRHPGYHDNAKACRGGPFVPTQTHTRPQEESSIGLGEPWMVILFNDDHHTFDEVIAQVQKATGCGPGEAFQITYAAHSHGQAVAYVGERPACEQVAKVLREIDLHVEIEAA